MESEATQKGRKPRKHTHTPSSSSNDSMFTNPTLPQELIAAILVRLPVRYLLAFKCVSKDWLALISSPDFVKAHLRFSAKDYSRHSLLLNCVNGPSLSLKYCCVSSLFNKTVTTEAYDLELPVEFPDGLYFPIVVGSVNGLICLTIRFGALVLWNPCLMKFKELPVIPKPTYSCFAMNGFGYDEVHDDYKVVVITCRNNGKCVVYIFSLKSDSWRRTEDFHSGLPSGGFATLVSGKLYWRTKRGDRYGIMSFDLVDEKLEKLERPSSAVGFLFLGLLGGDFCVLQNYDGGHCEVWVMKEYRVWTKLYSMKYPDGYAVSAYSLPICMTNEGELLLNYNSTLTVYNPKDDSIRHPQINNGGNSTKHLYMESLVCPILQTEPRIQQGCS